MRIHALILARDESPILAECIHSLHAATEAISVFDTGSRDRTREIALDSGADWRPIPWIEDFSAARNAALKQIESDWVLVLDADERLDTGATRSILATLEKATTRDLAFCLEQRTYTDDHEALSYNGLPLSESMRRRASGYVLRTEPRLFRHKRGLHYRGIVCEQLHDAEGRVLTASASSIGTIHHLRELQPLDRRKRMEKIRLKLALREALERESAESLGRLGILLTGMKRWREALRYLRWAEESHEPVPRLHFHAGVARQQLGLVEGGILSLRRALAAFPRDPEISTWLARALIESERTSSLREAEDLLDGALEQAPGLDLAVLQHAILLRRLGAYEEARADLQTLLERNPVHPTALKELGAVALLQGFPLESEEHLRQALRMRPEDPDLLNNLGCALERRGHWREALAAFDRALEFSYGNARMLHNRCLANAATQQLTDMCRDAGEALLASDNPFELLRQLRENCLDAGWLTALRRLETWALHEGWLTDDEGILTTPSQHEARVSTP